MVPCLNQSCAQMARRMVFTRPRWKVAVRDVVAVKASARQIADVQSIVQRRARNTRLGFLIRACEAPRPSFAAYCGSPTWRSASPIGSQISARPECDRTKADTVKWGSDSRTREAAARLYGSGIRRLASKAARGLRQRSRRLSLPPCPPPIEIPMPGRMPGGMPPIPSTPGGEPDASGVG
jgi:hypothetical protein